MQMGVSTGDIEHEMDPFFPFEEAVDVWARTFAALGIQYKGATMRLDLCDRAGKYSNGFCHWPQPAWRKVSPKQTKQSLTFWCQLFIPSHLLRWSCCLQLHCYSYSYSWFNVLGTS